MSRQENGGGIEKTAPISLNIMEEGMIYRVYERGMQGDAAFADICRHILLFVVELNFPQKYRDSCLL